MDSLIAMVGNAQKTLLEHLSDYSGIGTQLDQRLLNRLILMAGFRILTYTNFNVSSKKSRMRAMFQNTTITNVLVKSRIFMARSSDRRVYRI
jgi:hypothetical protein